MTQTRQVMMSWCCRLPVFYKNRYGRVSLYIMILFCWTKSTRVGPLQLVSFLDVFSETRQLDLVCPGLRRVVGTPLQMLRNGRHVSEAPGVHGREQVAELPHLQSQQGGKILLEMMLDSTKYEILDKACEGQCILYWRYLYNIYLW